MRRIVIATNNAHKVSEISNALDFDGWEFCTLADMGVSSSPEENGETFLDNARIKAESAREALTEQGIKACVLADDSGLEVDALDGNPGVYSSRYAGEDGNDAANNAKLLAELEGVVESKRTARFVCTLVFLEESGHEVTARGTIEGRIGYELVGEEGFGYDPLFIPDCFGGVQTLAQVPQAQKNAVSHRGNALRQLKARLTTE